jgi:hypothetical protein
MKESIEFLEFIESKESKCKYDEMNVQNNYGVA